jgi:hypothetical protein
MLIALRVIAIFGLTVIAFEDLFIGFIVGAALFGETPGTNESIASWIFGILGLVSLAMMVAIAKFRHSYAKLARALITYAITLPVGSMIAAYLADADSYNGASPLAFFQYSGLILPYHYQELALTITVLTGLAAATRTASSRSR